MILIKYKYGKTVYKAMWLYYTDKPIETLFNKKKCFSNIQLCDYRGNSPYLDSIIKIHYSDKQTIYLVGLNTYSRDWDRKTGAIKYKRKYSDTENSLIKIRFSYYEKDTRF